MLSTPHLFITVIDYPSRHAFPLVHRGQTLFIVINRYTVSDSCLPVSLVSTRVLNEQVQVPVPSTTRLQLQLPVDLVALQSTGLFRIWNVHHGRIQTGGTGGTWGHVPPPNYWLADRGGRIRSVLLALPVIFQKVL